MYFSKKPYNVFLEYGGYGQNDVLIKKSKARILKPAFTIVCDRSSQCFLLFIRGAISVKERLTAATGAEVPFHHVVVQEGQVSNLVLGYAHCGMVVAARWIAKQAIPCLSKAIEQFPEYEVKIIGHSMGAGIATILTYILRENEKLASSTCIAFGPAACMTWDLAESGKDFVTSIVNRNDLVPSLGLVSAAKLRAEVMSSSWAHDLRKQIQQTRFLGFVNRSVSFIRSHVPFVSDPRSKVVDVDMMQSQSPEAGSKPSADTHAVVKKRPALACWSCVAAPKQSMESSIQIEGTKVQTDTGVQTEKTTEAATAALVSIHLGELNLQEPDNREEKGSALTETDEDAMELLESLTDEKQLPSSSSSGQEPHQLYPPGKILHMVGLPAAEEATTSQQGAQEEVIALYETPRHLYSKIRLARSMIGEHYMPKYIKTMEQLIDKLAEDIDDQLDSL
ncbi:Putative lipase class 3 family protein [Zea mays]|nr:Putative lipase class 3 family protein [Zea mays]